MTSETISYIWPTVVDATTPTSAPSLPYPIPTGSNLIPTTSSNLSGVTPTNNSCHWLLDISLRCHAACISALANPSFNRFNITTCNGTAIGLSTPATSMAATSDFYVGLVLAMCSSIFIGTSFILKKKALLRLAAQDLTRRAGVGGHGYLKQWLWWAGVITMGVGEACNFAAYAFAPATLVTPLGALSVLVTSVLSSRLLNERLNLLGKIGCAICILGSTFIVLHSPRQEEVESMEMLSQYLMEPGFVLYVLCVIVSSVVLIFYVGPKYGQSNILIYVFVCSIIGSLSVVGVKGLGLAIRETILGRNQLTNWLTWFFLASLVFCVTLQLNYLNKSLDIFNTSMVTPIYYVFFTFFVIFASAILYKEWMNLGVEDIIGSCCGFLVTVVGVFQMQLFRDVNVTLAQLLYMFRGRSEAPITNGSVGGFSQPPPSDSTARSSLTRTSSYSSSNYQNYKYQPMFTSPEQADSLEHDQRLPLTSSDVRMTHSRRQSDGYVFHHSASSGGQPVKGLGGGGSSSRFNYASTENINKGQMA